MEMICLDSDVLIQIMRGERSSVAWLKQAEATADLATTSINVFELYQGAFFRGDSQVSYLENILSRLKCIEITPAIARTGGKLAANLRKNGIEVDFRDVLIAAAVSAENMKLKTFNTKHFARLLIASQLC